MAWLYACALVVSVFAAAGLLFLVLGTIVWRASGPRRGWWRP